MSKRKKQNIFFGLFTFCKSTHKLKDKTIFKIVDDLILHQSVSTKLKVQQLDFMQQAKFLNVHHMRCRVVYCTFICKKIITKKLQLGGLKHIQLYLYIN